MHWLETAPCLKMAVFNRYGRDQHGIGLLTGMDGVTGAAALTYGHDCHNLTVYGGNDADMALAANTLRDAQGGLCTAENGKVLTLIPLPLAGLMCDQSPEALLAQMEQFLADCRRMGFTHQKFADVLHPYAAGGFAGAEMHGPGSGGCAAQAASALD